MGVEAGSRWLKVDPTGGDRAPLPLFVLDPIREFLIALTWVRRGLRDGVEGRELSGDAKYVRWYRIMHAAHLCTRYLPIRKSQGIPNAASAEEGGD